MVFPMELLKTASHWMLSCYKIYNLSSHRPTSSSPPKPLPTLYPVVTKCSCVGRQDQTIVCDIQGTLLRSTSLFPYFMLVAFEGGSIIRALLLLLSYPLLLLLNHAHPKLHLRLVIFISFCGLTTKDMDTVARAVLPKFFLEDLNLHAYQVVASTGRRVVLTCMPRVMVERFLKEYVGVDVVVGTELEVVGGRFFSGAISASGILTKHKAFKDVFGDTNPDLALGNSDHDHLFMSLCKEAYDVVNNKDGGASATSKTPREKYPKALVFHDGRLAFFPTPLSTLLLFLWLPVGVALAIARAMIGTCIPYNLAVPANALTGLMFRVKGLPSLSGPKGGGGVLYVCTHRTLLDPVAVSAVLKKPITAVTYSLSRFSEMISPIRTVRLTRNRSTDGATMKALLEEGDLLVCPEGTTCREPYLLRFSPLFAEITDDIVPVAVDVEVTMFYGTTASGHKWLDPFFLLMNPNPVYYVHFLRQLPPEKTCSGGRCSREVANGIQKELADVLGFECTSLTRRDKYLMLAGNEGIVAAGARKGGGAT